MRGILTGAVMARMVGSAEALIATQAWAARLRKASVAAHLTIKTVILLAVILFGLVLGAWLSRRRVRSACGGPLNGGT